jgi:DNA mismatch repair ATPase MutL
MSNVFTDADAESLAQMLEKRAIPFGGMSLEQLDGFLSGVAVSPEAIAQADWMPRVWGKEPRWEGARDRDEHYAPILHLKAAVERGGLDVQRLLVPERIDLSPAELELVQEHAATLRQAGMEVEPFGGTTVIVTSKPVLAGKTPAAAIVREALDRLATVAAGPGRAASLLVDEVLHGLACKAAIKAGDPLSQPEVDALVRDRRLVRESHHCPHGRPTSLTLSRHELDRQFRRM